MSKKCPNGHPVEDWDIICPVCNLDLTALRHQQPTPVKDPPLEEEENAEGSEPCSPTLELVSGSETFPCENGTVLGRKGTLAKHLFEAIETVSREHLFLCLEDDVWRVTVGKNVSNSTTLDGDEMDRDKPYPLDEGEYELTMSRACKISLRVKMPEKSQDQ